MYSIDTNPAVSIVLLHSPVNPEECCIHAMDAYRKAGDAANNGDTLGFWKNHSYAKSKVEMALRFIKDYPKKRSWKRFKPKSDRIASLLDTLERQFKEISAN